MYLVALLMMIFIVCRYSEFNRLHKVLVGILSFWVIGRVISIYDLLAMDEGYYFNSYLLSYSRMLRGIASVFIFLLYPMFAVLPRLFRLPVIYLSIAPLVLLHAIYWIFALSNDISPFYRFYDYADIATEGHRTIFYFRVAIMVYFIIAFIYVSNNLKKILNLYQKYVEDNYSDINHNVKWLKSYNKAVLAMAIAHIIFIIYVDIYTAWIYVIVSSLALLILVDNSLKYKQFVRTEENELLWTFKDGWHFPYKPQSSTDSDDQKADEKQILSAFQEFEQWVINRKRYFFDDFTLSEVTENFPSLDHATITSLLEKKGYTFQSYVQKLRIDEMKIVLEWVQDSKLFTNSAFSYKDIAIKFPYVEYNNFDTFLKTEYDSSFQTYVRRLRIDEAIQLMKQDEEHQMQIKEIAYAVGFENNASFSRAFKAVTGHTASSYVNNPFTPPPPPKSLWG